MILILVISAVIRIIFTPITSSGDYNLYLLPWVEEYRKLGVVRGLSTTIGDYYVPYNLIMALTAALPWPPYVMISLSSCVADYVGAFFLYKIALLILDDKNQGNETGKAKIIAVSILFLPCVVLNSSYWKQCDAVYTCFMIIALYMLLKEKYFLMFFFYSISFCFKLQAIFMLPFLLIIYMVKKKYSLFHFFMVPLMYLLIGIPSVIMQKGIRATYGVYFHQTNEWHKMSVNFPNIYKFGLGEYDSMSKYAILITIVIFIIATLYCYYYRKGFDRYNTVALCAWSIWTCCMFLPSMHERYDYAAILLVTVWALSSGCAKNIWIAIAMNFCAMMSYSNYLFDTNIDILFIAIIYCVAYFAATYIMAMNLSKQHKEY